MGKLRHQKMRGVIQASPLWGILGWPLLNEISGSRPVIGYCSPTSDKPPSAIPNHGKKRMPQDYTPMLSGGWPYARYFDGLQLMSM